MGDWEELQPSCHTHCRAIEDTLTGGKQRGRACLASTRFQLGPRVILNGVGTGGFKSER